MTRHCPVCDNPHDTWGGVATHMWKKSDEEHEHVESKDGGLEWLARNGHMGAADTADDDSDVDGREDTTETTDTDTGTDTMEFPEADGNGTEDGESGEQELPCGHESFDMDKAPEPPFGVECDECGESWVVEG